MKTIDVTVSPEAKMTVETKGFTGAACQAATKQLEDLLFANKEERKTAEYYKQAEQHVRARS